MSVLLEDQTIAVMSEQLANQIAAGEVVERPASVVKELVENALDAGATAINVELSQGGLARIRVTDNGIGLSKPDLSLAVLPHATSKIMTYDDLTAVASLGFRGEALASIASVSRFSITSKQPQAEHAWCWQEGDIRPAAHPVGTTVDVQELFYNTPARRKFMKSPRTESRHCQTVIERQALARFDVSFTLTHEGKIVFSTQAGQSPDAKAARLSALLGKEFVKHSVYIDFSASGYQLCGWLGLPHHNRSQPDQQITYVNGRFIKDKLLMRALKQGYHDVMFHGRHAVFVLTITCEASLVDVNVHPTKHEVRFRDSQTVFDVLNRGIKNALAQSPASASQPVTSTTAAFTRPFKPSPVFEGSHQAEPWQVIEPQMPLQASPLTEAVMQPRLGTAVAQLHGTYIIAQNAQGMVVIDQHAVHERILYEKLKVQYKSGRVIQQQLLLPVSLSLSPAEMSVLLTHWQSFVSLGFDMDQAGPQAMVCRAIPAILPSNHVVTLLKDMITDCESGCYANRGENAIDMLLATMGCRGAIKANHAMTLVEMNALIADMEQTPNSGVCNHGRPSWVAFNRGDMDKWFLRGQ